MTDLYAEDVNYWKTSKSSPDTWMSRAKHQIEQLGGQILLEGFGSEAITGRAAFMLTFAVSNDRFKITWPVLPSKNDNERAARVQAATMLYHDVKAKCISAAVLGARAAFFSFLMLPGGRTTAEMSTPELMQAIPEMLAPSVPQLDTGDVLEGKFDEMKEETDDNRAISQNER